MLGGFMLYITLPLPFSNLWQFLSVWKTKRKHGLQNPKSLPLTYFVFYYPDLTILHHSYSVVALFFIFVDFFLKSLFSRSDYFFQLGVR